METQREKETKKNNGWMSVTVPQFGGWDSKSPGANDYSMVFSRARANKKQQKADIIKRTSLGNEKELMNATATPLPHDDSVMQRKNKILTYINCCIRP